MQKLCKLLAKESIVDIKLTPNERAEIELQYRMRRDLITERVKTTNPDVEIPCISLDYDKIALDDVANSSDLFKGLPVVGVANENIAAIISAKSSNQALLEAYNRVIKSAHTDSLIRDLASLGTSAYCIVSGDSIINTINLEAIPLVTRDNEFVINQKEINNGVLIDDKASIALSQLPLVKARLIALNDYIIKRMKKETERRDYSRFIFPIKLSDINDQYFQQLIILTNKLNREFFNQLEKIYEDCTIYAEDANYSPLKQLLDDIATSYNALCTEVEIKYNNNLTCDQDNKLIPIIAEETIVTDIKTGYDKSIRNITVGVRNSVDETLKIADVIINRIEKLIGYPIETIKSNRDIGYNTKYNGEDSFTIEITTNDNVTLTYHVDLSSIDHPIIVPYNKFDEEKQLENTFNNLTSYKQTIYGPCVSLYEIIKYIKSDIDTFHQCHSDISKYISVDGVDVDIVKTIEKMCSIYSHYCNKSDSKLDMIISEFSNIENPIDDYFKFSDICKSIIDLLKNSFYSDKHVLEYNDIKSLINLEDRDNLITTIKDIYSELKKYNVGTKSDITSQEIDTYRVDNCSRQRLIISQIVSKIFYIILRYFLNAIKTSFNLVAKCCELNHKNKIIENFVIDKTN